MRITATAIPEVKLIEPIVHGDGRGFFMESWSASAFADAGISASFVQDNHSRSALGVLRGLHFQLPQAQAKLIRVIAGAVFDVAVDLRRSSPTFGCWVGHELSSENRHMLWIPEGFAHGFVTLADGTELLYKCTAPYAPAHERSIAWDDPMLRIAWRSRSSRRCCRRVIAPRRRWPTSSCSREGPRHRGGRPARRRSRRDGAGGCDPRRTAAASA